MAFANTFLKPFKYQHPRPLTEAPGHPGTRWTKGTSRSLAPINRDYNSIDNNPFYVDLTPNFYLFLNSRMIKVRNAQGEYPCYLCEANLNSKKDLRLHTISHHKGDEHKICSECKMTFKDISSVRRHIKTVHRRVKQFVCSFCEKRYSHKFDLENHFRKNHSQVYDDAYKMCTECKFAARSAADLKSHMLTTHNIVTNKIKCPFCMKIFFDPIYVKQHCKRVHGNATGQLYICKFCCVVSECVDSHKA